MQIGFRGQLAALGAGLLACAALALACAPGALAVPRHSFDAALSLEGGCKADDGTPDPGCPGGPLPPKAFDDACGVGVDRHGDIYVSSAAIGTSGTGTGGRIDVYDPEGNFLTEIADEHQPCDLAVDSEGNLYVAEYAGKDVALFEPGSYPPEAGEAYSPSTVYEDEEAGCTDAWGVAVDPADDHLYAALNCMVVEYASAAEGSGVVREGIGSFLPVLRGIDVYGPSGDLYLASAVPGSAFIKPENARLYVIDGTSEAVECEASGFSFFSGRSGVSVDQANGDAYVDDTRENQAVRQFDSGCGEIGELPAPPALVKPNPFSSIAVDDPCLVGVAECNPSAPYLSPNEGYVFLGSGSEANKSHLYAYKPRIVEPPEIKAQRVSGVSEGEARLEAEVKPNGFETTYHFEYVSEERFAEDGFKDALSTPEQSAGAAGSFGTVSTAVAGLQAGSSYRFRAVADNCKAQEDEGISEPECLTLGEGNPGAEGAEAAFATYPAPPTQSCPNQALRVGPSAALPDCRAYELVTPVQTNGRIPTMSELGGTNDNGFDTDLVSADGQSLAFGIDGGSLPDIGGNGFHDTYLATRGAEGWQSELGGLAGTEAQEAYPGGISPDHRYSLWFGRGSGTTGLAAGNYLRSAADGAVVPIGIGSLGTDLDANGELVSADARHVIFTSDAHLEPDAPPSGIDAVYDREVGGGTAVVSLLPGGKTPTSKATFEGATADGEAVAFAVGGALYLRRGGQTQEVSGEEVLFGGLSADGQRLTYLLPHGELEGEDPPPYGDLFSYDAQSEGAQAVGSGGESVLVNVSADGSRVFFISPLQLAGGQGTPGAHNLYAWDADGEAIEFIATVTDRDVLGEPTDATLTLSDGLGLWINHVVNPFKHTHDGPGADPSRSTADGEVLIFESRAPLGEYASEGHAEIYRYAGGELDCISCNPTGVPPGTDARLQGPTPRFLFSLPPLNSLAHTYNLSADGQSAFFQSAEPLVGADADGKVDVYEWKAEGKGGCELPRGCLALISSPHSAAEEYLYAATADGHDVFIETAEPLVSADPDGGHSIYDARIDGGFAPPPGAAEPCASADACRAPSPAPSLPAAIGGPFAAQNASAPKRRRCARAKKKKHGKGRTRRGGGRHKAKAQKTRRTGRRCAKKKRGKTRHRHHRRARRQGR